MQNLIADHIIGRVRAPAEYFQFGTGNLGLSAFLSIIVEITIYAAAATTLLFLIIGSIQWILSNGDPKAISHARGKVVTAVIGLAIVLLALSIIRLIEYFLRQQIL